MLAVLTLLVVPLAAAQGDALTLSGAHFTHGVLGPARADRQVVPGDSLFLTFDIENLTADPTGKVKIEKFTATNVFDIKAGRWSKA